MAFHNRRIRRPKSRYNRGGQCGGLRRQDAVACSQPGRNFLEPISQFRQLALGRSSEISSAINIVGLSTDFGSNESRQVSVENRVGNEALGHAELAEWCPA